MSFVMDIMEKKMGKNVANKRLIDTFAPRLIGARIGSECYTKVMDEQREKLKAAEKTNKVIDALIDKLLHDDEDASQKSFIGEIVDRIKLKIPAKTRTPKKGEK
jgi:predicted phage gp36 major capsid-like protein